MPSGRSHAPPPKPPPHALRVLVLDAARDGAQRWRDDAACRGADTSMFIVESSATTLVKEAKSYCEVCDVRLRCLAFALLNPSFMGVWGGTTDRERAQLRRDIRM